MEIGLIDVDSHNYPNLALMKISAWHKAKGDHVEWWNGLKHYDRVYQAKVFDSTYTPDNEYVVDADEVIKGGTGYDLHSDLPEEIEHILPDYGLYNITDTAYGFLTRGCPRHCPFCIVGDKEGLCSHKVADLDEFWTGQKHIEILDPNLLACEDREELLCQLADSGSIINFNQGIDVRFLTKDCADLINKCRTSMIHFAWDNYEEHTRRCLENAREWIEEPMQRVRVYVLTNYNTTTDQDLYRVYAIRDIGFDPYVMIYDKPHAPHIAKQIQRWCNAKAVFRMCPDFNEYIWAEKEEQR